MGIDFTPYLWVNWAILFGTGGALWTTGSWIASRLLSSLDRKAAS